MRLRGAILLLVLIGGSATARAQLLGQARSSDEEIQIDAESMGYDRKADTVVGTGNVVIRRGDSVLHADTVQLNRTTNEASASGDVCLTDPDGVICGVSMRLDLDDETGEIVGARIEARQKRYTLRGDEVAKEKGQKYRIKNGYFTTCNCGEDSTPSWSITADQLDLEIDGYGKVAGAKFNVLDVPVLYLPYGALPVGRERQSGFLFPRTGASNKRGFQIFQPLYWAINKSHDVTLGVDVETSARVGVVGEYRYALSENSVGSVNASYFNEAIRGQAKETSEGDNDNPSVPVDRWGVGGEHTQTIGDTKAYADLLLVGDNTFLREMNVYRFVNDEEVALRTRPFTDSNVGVIHPWDRAVLQAEAIYYQDLVDRDALVLQRVPEIAFDTQKFLPYGVLAQLGTRATDFQREEGIDGLRGELDPAVEVRLPLGRSVHGSAGLRLRGAAYQLSDHRMDGGYRGDGVDETDRDGNPGSDGIIDGSNDPYIVDLPDNSLRGVVEARARIGTGVDRVFDFDRFGFERLRHTIEPQIEYHYIPDISQGDVMVFDGLDRIDRRNMVTYGIATRLLGRRAGVVDDADRIWELTRFSISQGFDFSRDVPKSTDGGNDDHFSDIDLALRVNPIDRTSIRFNASYDPTSGELTSTTVGLRLREGKVAGEGRLENRTSIGVSYRFITEDPLRQIPDTADSVPPGPGPTPVAVSGSSIGDSGIQQIDADIALRVTQRLGLLYATRFNAREERFLENHFGMRILSSCDCWSLDLGLTDKSNPNEIELRVQLMLVGLGGGFGNAP